MQEELQNVLTAINKWVEKNESNVVFIGDFISFDKEKIKNNEDDTIMDATRFAYGCKECLTTALEETIKDIEQEKDEFINW